MYLIPFMNDSYAYENTFITTLRFNWYEYGDGLQTVYLYRIKIKTESTE